MRRLAGLLALLGGACWTVKAAAILAGGAQPYGLFEWAPAAMGVALAVLTLTPGWRVGVLGALAAWCAALLGPAAGAAYVAMPEHWLFNGLFFLANLAVVVALYLVGRRVRHQAALGRRSGLPRRIGLWTVPAVLAGGLLAEVQDRLLELPILLLGLAWLTLGVVILGARNRAPEPEAPRKVTRAPARSTSGGHRGPPR